MTLTAWFEAEAATCLAMLEAVAQRADFDRTEAHRAARRLAGAARLAGVEAAGGAAAVLVEATRPDESDLLPASVVRERLIRSLEHLRRLLLEHGEPAGAGVTAIRALWRVPEPDQPAPAIAPVGESSFLDWAAREIAGFADTLGDGVERFASDPDDRETLAGIIHRQRSLLGAARLGEVAVAGETLRALDELTQLIVRLDVPVKTEWLDVFRTARDALRSAVTALAQGATPAAVPALSRLRTLRTELMDRYGAREAGAEPAPADSQPPAASDAVSAVPPHAGSGSPVVAAAREHEHRPDAEAEDPQTEVLALRAVIERAIDDDPEARAALDRLVGLLREGRS